MPTTNNVVESNNRNTNRFLSYKDMPVVVAAHDVFRFCRHELKQIIGIRAGLVSVKAREAARRGALSSRTDEWVDRRRPPTNTKELLTDEVSAFTALSKRPRATAHDITQASKSGGAAAKPSEVRSNVTRDASHVTQTPHNSHLTPTATITQCHT
jgi:hypothetical protein